MHTETKRQEGRMLEILLVIGGLIVGAGGALLMTQKKSPSDDTTSQTQQEVIKQLTDLDVIKELCAPDRDWETSDHQ